MDKKDSNIFPFPSPLHVGRPNIGNRDTLLQRMNRILDNVWLTNNGPLVQEFEQQIARFVGVKHCIATCNGTLALELAIRALGLKGEVIVPSFTFVATAHALQWQEITPVFCDIDPRTGCIDPVAAARLITPQTSAIIGVHLFGRPCNIPALQDLAATCGLQLIFDAAHAFGCTYQGKQVGGFGACEIFSFHATKVLNAFEGGAIVTNDDALAGQLRLMKNFGFAGEDTVIYVGTNGKMTEMSAAMGLTNLESFADFVRVNQQHYKTYVSELSSLPGLTLMTFEDGEQHNYHYIVVRIDEKRFGMTRDALKGKLARYNILARRYFYPGCHRMEPYATLYPDLVGNLEITEQLCRQVLVLPTGTQAGNGDIVQVCRIIRDIQESLKKSPAND